MGNSPLCQLASVMTMGAASRDPARSSAMAAMSSPQVLKIGALPHIICERSQPSASQISISFVPACSRCATL